MQCSSTINESYSRINANISTRDSDKDNMDVEKPFVNSNASIFPPPQSSSRNGLISYPSQYTGERTPSIENNPAHRYIIQNQQTSCQLLGSSHTYQIATQPNKNFSGSTENKSESYSRFQTNLQKSELSNNASNRNNEYLRFYPQIRKHDNSRNITPQKIINLLGANVIDKHRKESNLQSVSNMAALYKNQDIKENNSFLQRKAECSSTNIIPRSNHLSDSSSMHPINLSREIVQEQQPYFDKYRSKYAKYHLHHTWDDQNTIRSIHLERRSENGIFNGNINRNTSNEAHDQIMSAKNRENAEYPLTYKFDENATRHNDIMMNDATYATIDEYRKNKQRVGYFQDANNTRRSKLAKIDGIIETFVSAMRETQIRRDFTIKIVNLHKSVSNGNDKGDGKIDPESKCFMDMLRLSDLINHFSSMVESFVTFAKNCPAFQDLCVEDQSELLKKNSLMFVMVSLFFC